MLGKWSWDDFAELYTSSFKSDFNVSLLWFISSASSFFTFYSSSKEFFFFFLFFNIKLSWKILDFVALLKLLLFLLFIPRVWWNSVLIHSETKIIIIEKFLIDFVIDKFYLLSDLLDFSLFKNYIKIISTIVYIINVWMLNKLYEKYIQIRCMNCDSF